MTITQFRGKHAFLSNFYHAPIVWGGVTWPTVEHGYQAMKTDDKNAQRRIAMLDTPAEAKRAGRAVTIRPDWPSVKFDLMNLLLVEKFDQWASLMRKLRDTSPRTLVEQNFWHDNYWGDCVCTSCVKSVGGNRLGEILMRIRAEATPIGPDGDTG